MTSVFITGASGFLGQYVVARCLADDTLTPITGGRSSTGARGAPSIAYGDLDDMNDITASLKDVDVVVHCAGRAHVLRETTDDPLPAFLKTNCDATVRLAQQAVTAGVKRFVFISSIGVLGNQTDGTPFQADNTPAPHAPYAVSKLQAELALEDIARDTGLEVVVIRPPLILGPHPIGNLGSLMKVIRKGLPLPFALVRNNKRSLARVETVADLIATVTTHPAAAGETFLVADEPALSTRDIIVALADTENLTPRFLPVPPGLLKAALGALGKTSLAQQLFGDLELDITHTKSTLGWHPPILKRS